MFWDGGVGGGFYLTLWGAALKCSIMLNERGFFCFLEMLLFNSYRGQRCLGHRDSGRSLFHPRPVSLSTNNIAGRTIKGSRPARRNPVSRRKKKRMRGVISPPHCQEFNFTQLTSATDKWNINNVTHTRSEARGKSSGLFPGELLHRRNGL